MFRFCEDWAVSIVHIVNELKLSLILPDNGGRNQLSSVIKNGKQFGHVLTLSNTFLSAHDKMSSLELLVVSV